MHSKVGLLPALPYGCQSQGVEYVVHKSENSCVGAHRCQIYCSCALSQHIRMRGPSSSEQEQEPNFGLLAETVTEALSGADVICQKHVDRRKHKQPIHNYAWVGSGIKHIDSKYYLGCTVSSSCELGTMDLFGRGKEAIMRSLKPTSLKTSNCCLKGLGQNALPFCCIQLSGP